MRLIIENHQPLLEPIPVTLLHGYTNPLKRLDTSESVNHHKCLILLDSCRIHATRWPSARTCDGRCNVSSGLPTAPVDASRPSENSPRSPVSANRRCPVISLPW